MLVEESLNMNACTINWVHADDEIKQEVKVVRFYSCHWYFPVIVENNEWSWFCLFSPDIVFLLDLWSMDLSLTIQQHFSKSAFILWWHYLLSFLTSKPVRKMTSHVLLRKAFAAQIRSVFGCSSVYWSTAENSPQQMPSLFSFKRYLLNRLKIWHKECDPFLWVMILFFSKCFPMRLWQLFSFCCPLCFLVSPCVFFFTHSYFSSKG